MSGTVETKAVQIETTDSASLSFDSPELQRSFFSPLFILVYRLLGCPRRLRLATFLLSVIIRIENPMRSATARQLMWQYHGVKIGPHSYGSCFDPVAFRSGVTIGRYTSVAEGVKTYLQNHPVDTLSTHPYFYEGATENAQPIDLPGGSLDIGHDVWIGSSVIILPGCKRIGNGAIVGAGAILTKDVPDYCIVAGNPAKRIRDRFPPEIIAKLQASQWWLLPIKEVQRRLPELTKLLHQNS
ncbi:CatB-related O-acetyltransferase [Schlesneria sp. DSM 10557]|uniref:CatB-related O-acetyltransferase n=1 Tax=Schlesneria sp. DSM 10557 TaxID=3044399 RepID=UPI0035A1103E